MKRVHFCHESNFDKDRDYWNHFYFKNEGLLSEPSNFAHFVARYLTAGKHLLELGCGNGRDSLYFLELGLKVTGIDASDYVIDRLNQKFANNINSTFVCDDFIRHLSVYKSKYDYIYSRFSLHAISDSQENELLTNIKSVLSNNGLLFVEARTVHDSLYGKGINVNKNAYIYDNHYRRFIETNDFIKKLKRLKFEILFFKEQTGFSKTDTSDPVLLRCVARLIF